MGFRRRRPLPRALRHTVRLRETSEGRPGIATSPAAADCRQCPVGRRGRKREAAGHGFEGYIRCTAARPLEIQRFGHGPVDSGCCTMFSPGNKPLRTGTLLKPLPKMGRLFNSLVAIPVMQWRAHEPETFGSVTTAAVRCAVWTGDEYVLLSGGSSAIHVPILLSKDSLWREALDVGAFCRLPRARNFVEICQRFIRGSRFGVCPLSRYTRVRAGSASGVPVLQTLCRGRGPHSRGPLRSRRSAASLPKAARMQGCGRNVTFSGSTRGKRGFGRAAFFEANVVHQGGGVAARVPARGMRWAPGSPGPRPHQGPGKTPNATVPCRDLGRTPPESGRTLRRKFCREWTLSAVRGADHPFLPGSLPGRRGPGRSGVGGHWVYRATACQRDRTWSFS